MNQDVKLDHFNVREIKGRNQIKGYTEFRIGFLHDSA